MIFNRNVDCERYIVLLKITDMRLAEQAKIIDELMKENAVLREELKKPLTSR